MLVKIGHIQKENLVSSSTPLSPIAVTTKSISRCSGMFAGGSNPAGLDLRMEFLNVPVWVITSLTRHPLPLTSQARNTSNLPTEDTIKLLTLETFISCWWTQWWFSQSLSVLTQLDKYAASNGTWGAQYSLVSGLLIGVQVGRRSWGWGVGRSILVWGLCLKHGFDHVMSKPFLVS